MSTDNYELSGETLNRQIAELPVLLEDVKEKLKEKMKMFNMGSNGCALSRETLQEFEESFNTLMGSVKEKEMNIQRSIQCLLNNNSNKNAISNFDGSKQASQCKNAANLKDNSVEISLSVSNDVECSVELNKFPEALNKDVMICERADDSLFIGNSAEKTVSLENNTLQSPSSQALGSHHSANLIIDEGGDESITVETRMNDAAETTADLSHSSFFFKDQPVQEEVLPLISTDKSSDTGDGQTINELDKANKEAIRLSNVTDKCFIKVRKMDVAKLILKQKLRTDPEDAEHFKLRSIRASANRLLRDISPTRSSFVNSSAETMDLDETDEPYNEEEQDENFVNKRVKKAGENCSVSNGNTMRRRLRSTASNSKATADSEQRTNSGRNRVVIIDEAEDSVEEEEHRSAVNSDSDVRAIDEERGGEGESETADSVESEPVGRRPMTRNKLKEEVNSLLKKRVVISSSDGSDVEHVKSGTKTLKKSGDRKRKTTVSSSSEAEILSSDSEEEDEESDDGSVFNEDIESGSDVEKSSNQKRKTIPSGGFARKFKESKYVVRKSSAKKRRILDSDDDLVRNTDEEVEEERPVEAKSKYHRKMMTKKDLAQSTLNAEKMETERRERLQEKQLQFNGIELAEDASSGEISMRLADKSILAPQLKSLTLDRDEKSDEPCPVQVHSALVALLKPHQAEGIKFMYNSLFESIDRLDKPDSCGGILAHCMGLGKTFQVIAFLHTILTHPKISKVVRRVMIVGPKNVVTNWSREFTKWLADVDPLLNTINLYEMSDQKLHENRLKLLKQWFHSKKPSALIINYEMFRILTESEEDKPTKNKQKKTSERKKCKKLEKLKEQFRMCLQDPGADLVICDEGHKLKSDETSVFRTMSKIKTSRRLCLSGTPMQNNLKEYYTMINFVKPGLLGTKIEFANRFSNIITRGQTIDATPMDVRRMKRRCHVLYETLRYVVQRRDYRVLVETIPPKQEYVIYVRLTEAQCTLYQRFLDTFVSKCDLATRKRLLPDYHIFYRIWTHPFLLLLDQREKERKSILQDDRDFVVSGSESLVESVSSSKSGVEEDDEIICDSNIPSTSRQVEKRRRSTRQTSVDNEAEEDPPGWFTDLVSADDEYKYELSNKLILLFQILKKCEEIGDKLLVFTQSLESLYYIRRILSYLSKENLWFVDGHESLKNGDWGWINGIDYLIIDGSVNNKTRDYIQEQFNDPLNLRARLMLISTLAGSLGTNLVTANRVVIFDACWNPSHDTQAMFRVYRYGQVKPVYIYRLIAQGTMEEKIYKRQVTKESTAKRVTEEAQIQRHFKGSDLYELYEFNAKKLCDTEDSQITRLAPPKDRLLADVIFAHGNTIVSYMQHDSLFDEIEEEKLTDKEREEAWEDYEREKKQPPSYGNNGGSIWPDLPANLVILPNNSPVLTSIATRCAGSPLYRACFTISGMTADIGCRVMLVKEMLDRLMPQIPLDRRGGINEFDTYFLNIIQDVYNQHAEAKVLLEKVIRVFQTTIAIVRDIPACAPTIENMFCIARPLFEHIIT